NITWDGRRMDSLVVWITSRAADRHILFHDRSSSTLTKLIPSDKPSGKNKKEVSTAIAKHIFKDDPDHSSAYEADPARYVTSIINRLGTLKSKYCKQRVRFKSTGSGVLPQADGEMDAPAQNLLGMLYLDAIWNGIPSFDSELVSSKPGVNHTESLLKIVK
ncbi:hypothetical protein L210DRAFT_793454, partial [Boletus edulis BED1]